MLPITALSLFALLAVPAIARFPHTRGHGSRTLENNEVFQARYTALGCANRQADIDFFESCCHQLPLGAKPDPTCEARSTPRRRSNTGRCKPKPTTTSTPEPKPTTTPKPAPKPTTTPKPAPKPTSAPKDDKSSGGSTNQGGNNNGGNNNGGNNNSSGSSVNTGGFATFFTQNGVAGACGKVHQDSDLICAMDSARYGDASKESSLCGKQVLITNTKNGKSVTVTVADDCPTCVNANSIDLSTGAFNRIADPVEGMVPIKWHFLN